RSAAMAWTGPTGGESSSGNGRRRSSASGWRCPSTRTTRTVRSRSLRTACSAGHRRPTLVQTSLPLPDFDESARLLDVRRLGKQRVEALQVLRGLTVPGYGWRRHPAVLMWAGYEEALVRYGIQVCLRWRGLGHTDTCEATLRKDLRESLGITEPRLQA